MMQRFLFLFLFCFLSCATIQAQAKQQKLNQLFNDLEARGDFNGSVLVARGDKILYERHLGYADQEEERPNTGNTVFELASMGKQFTAMGIMVLQERKKLDYDAPVSEYIPEFPYSSVSIRHLLNMSSGIPDYLQFSGMLQPGTIPTNQDLINFYAKEKPALLFAPNTRFAYANINYVLLATIIEKASGTSFASFLETTIFAPAGMASTRSYNGRFTEGVIIPNYAYPYVKVDGQLVRVEDNPSTQYVIAASAIEGDGSIVSTPYDLFKWTKGLKTHKFVSAATLQEAYTPPVFEDGSRGEYGFGIYIGKDKVWHWGGWPGVQTSFTRYFDNDTVMIYLKNVETNNWKWVKQFEKLASK